MTAARLVARTVRGIEAVVADEIRERALGRVDRIRHREVWFTAHGPGPGPGPLAPLALRTADDVLALAAVVDGVGRTRADLRRLARAARVIPAARLQELLRFRDHCGRHAGMDGVEVVASFLGQRNYGRFDVEDRVGEQLAATLAVPYHSRRGGRRPPAGCATWRVTIEDGRALVGLRIACRPLHRRAYKQASVPGTLHPPLAAGLAWLAGLRPGGRLLDPFCGAATILVEAHALRPALRSLGIDRDPRALSAAATNALGVDGIALARADAGRLPLGGGSVDRVVTNPPWSRQVQPTGTLARRPVRFWHELRRVLAPGGLAVVLLHDADRHLAHATAAGLDVRQLRPVSLAGTHPAIATLAPSR